MSKIIGDNYSYKGKQPNFARDQFATKAEMNDFNPDFLDQGHISYCVEDDTHYKFNGEEWVKLIEDVAVEGGLSQVALPIFEITAVENVNNSSVTTGFIGVVYDTTSGKFIAAVGTALPGMPPTVTDYYSSWAATDKYPAPAVYAAKNTLYLKGTELYGFVDGSLKLVGDGIGGDDSGGIIIQ